MSDTPIANSDEKTVAFGGTTYKIQALGDDSYTVLVDGIPVGRIVYSFGAANGIPEDGSKVSEDTLAAIGEAWFAAVS